MCNKRKRQGPTWCEDQVVELLARLDLLVGASGPSQVSRKDKSETNKQHIMAKLHKTMTFTCSEEQIEQKLYDMFKSGDKWADDNFCRVFWFGSSEMIMLDQEMRDKVLQRFQNLQMTAPRQPRAIANIHQTQDKRKPGRSAVRGQRTIPNAAQHSSPGSRVQAPRKHGPIKIYVQRRKVSSPTIEAASREPASQSNTNMTSYSQLDPNIRRISRNNNNNSRSPVFLTQTADYEKLLADYEKLLPDHEKLLADHARLREEYTRVEADFKSQQNSSPKLLVEDLLADQAYYREKSLALENNCNRLELIDRQRASFVAETKGMPIKVQNAMVAMRFRNAELEKHLHTQRFLRQHIPFDANSTRAASSSKTSSIFPGMKSELISLSFISGLQHPHDNPLRDPSPDLKLLLCGILCGRSQLNPHNCTYATYKSFSANTIVQSLTGAALYQWILCAHFQESFQCAALIQCPLLESFRLYISSIGDAGLLLGLDTAAHQKVVTDEHVQDVFIPRIAIRLAERLLIILQPFISHENKGETVLLLKKKLKLIFQLAMELKIQAMISRAMYEYIWPVPKAAFERDSMVMENSGSPRAHVELTEQCNISVGMTLVPGLRIWKHEKKVVDYYGFVRGDEDDLEEPQVIYKAVVLI